MTHILKPITEPFDKEVETLLKAFPRQDGYLLSLFRVFANSARFLKKGVLNLLDKQSPLDLRIREIIILRVTGKYACHYEWGVHAAVFSKYARLTQEQLYQTVLGSPHEDCWDEKEQRLLEAVDALLDKGKLSNTLLQKFREQWRVEQQLEIFALCGNYQTISYVANSAELNEEAFGLPFPKPH